MVTCDKLCLTYDELRQSVDRISFTAKLGTIFALIGPNGAGKTSTLRMLAALVDPTSGSAEIDGTCVADEPQKVRQMVGYLPDDFALYDQVTAVEQLRFFSRLYGIPEDEANSRIDELLEEFDLFEQRETHRRVFPRHETATWLGKDTLAQTQVASARRTGLRSRPRGPRKAPPVTPAPQAGRVDDNHFLTHPSRSRRPSRCRGHS